MSETTITALRAWFRARRLRACERKGHRERRVFQRGHVLPWHPMAAEWWGFRCIAFDVGRTQTVCTRCRTVLATKVEHYGSLTGYSMPSDMAARLERDGEVWFG